MGRSGGRRTDWHRLFGLVLKDYFTDTPFQVDVEPDLSVREQFLDVVILRKDDGVFPGKLPDGLEDLARFNLITFKSFQETLDDWSLHELVGHYVNYRKQATRRKEPLLPEADFQLYAVSCRHPQTLSEQVTLQRSQAGVYDCTWGTKPIRVVVVSQLPETENNAPMHLFSASAERVAFGKEHFGKRTSKSRKLLERLFKGYQQERPEMPYTWDDFDRDYRLELLEELSPEERRKVLAQATPEERKEVLAQATPEEIRASMPMDKLLQGLTSEERTALERLLKASGGEPRPPEVPKSPGTKKRKR